MGFWKQLRSTFRARPVEVRIDDEVQFHLDMKVEDLKRAGYSEKEARVMARRHLGNAAAFKEQARDANVVIWLENWIRDFRQGWRGLRKRPMFAITSIASLAIGIGAVTSLFSVVDAVAWKPLALPRAQDLYAIQEFKKGQEAGSNGPRLRDWQTLRSFESVSGFYGADSVVWKGPRGAEAVNCLRVFSGAMQTFRPTVILGRTFHSREESNGEAVTLLTDRFWRTRMGADPAVLGKVMDLGGQAYVITGVLSPSIGYPEGVDLWAPAPLDLQNGTRAAGYLGIIARMRPTVRREAAQAEVAVMTTRLQAAYPETDAGLRASLTPLREQVAKEARTPLLMLLAVVACVLLMICVNISALLLARAGERQRESALRSALGANAASLVRLYLSETLLITVAGGMAGILLAMYGVDILKVILPAGTPRLADARVDWRVLLFGAGLSCLAGVVAGFIPSWRAARDYSIRDDGRSTGSRSRNRLRSAFVIAEVALSCLLVTTAVRMAESFVELAKRSEKFRTAQTFAVTIPFEWTTPNARLNGFAREALRRFAALPGVTQVGLVDRLPLSGGSQSGEVRIKGLEAETVRRSGRRAADRGYFAALGVPLLQGRLFEDRADRREAVVNQAFVRQHLAGAGAIGRQVSLNKGKNWWEIVGVVADVPQNAVQREAEPDLFSYYETTYWPILHFVIRSTAPLGVVGPQIRQEVGRIDPQALIDSIGTMEDALGEATRQPRITSMLVARSRC
jgi:putative ABC transport system permease protein